MQKVTEAGSSWSKTSLRAMDSRMPFHSMPVGLAERGDQALPARLGAGAAGVEHQAHGHVELAHGILRALEVAAHPVETVGNA